MDTNSATQKLSRDPTRLTPFTAKKKVHPALKQAADSFASLHGHKFGANAGRGFKKKAQ